MAVAEFFRQFFLPHNQVQVLTVLGASRFLSNRLLSLKSFAGRIAFGHIKHELQPTDFLFAQQRQALQVRHHLPFAAVQKFTNDFQSRNRFTVTFSQVRQALLSFLKAFFVNILCLVTVPQKVCRRHKI